MQVVIFSSPTRSKMLKELKAELRDFPVLVIDDPATFGRLNFWKRWEQARKACLDSKYDDFLILPDDVTRLDLDMIKSIAEINKGKLYTCNVINDGRASCWGKAKKNSHKFQMEDYLFKEVNFFDCGGITNRATLLKVKVKPMNVEWYKIRTSSGVGFNLTLQLRALNAKMYSPTPSLCFHGAHESVMHPEERKKNPLIAHPKMKLVVGIATMKGREKFLQKTIASLMNQCDEIRVYNNENREVDYTDNAKFYFLQEYDEPIYYLSCDDDIIYAPTYCKDMKEAIDRTKGIVTHHGRFLKRKGISYYRGGHRAFRCTGVVDRERVIHVAGTGVAGWRTDVFNPVNLYKDPRQRMSDCIFSLEAAKRKVKITVLPHVVGYLVAQPVPYQETIFGQHRGKDQVQSAIADEILDLVR